MKTGAVAGWLILAIATFCGEVAGKPLIHFNLETWRTDQGLPHGTVKSIAQDSDGYLWVATYEGVVRFDGVSFKAFEDRGVLAKDTTELLIDLDETLWIGTLEYGVHGFPKTGDPIRIDSAAGLASDHIWSLAGTGSEQLWIGTAEGLCVRAKGEMRCGLGGETVAEGPVTAIVPDGNALWLGVEGGGVFRLDLESERAVDMGDGLPTGRIQDLIRDPAGNLWAATFGDGLFRFQGERFVPVAGTEGLIRSLHAGPDGAVWIGTYGGGLQRLVGDALETLDSRLGMPNDHIHAIHADRGGNIWVGSNGGLTRLRDTAFSALGVEQGLAGPYVRSITEDHDGNIWVGSDARGVSVLHEGRVVDALDQSDGLAASSVRALWPRGDGSMLIATYGGALQRWFRGRLEPVVVEDLPTDLIRALYGDQDGNLWAAAYQAGVFRIRGEKTDFYTLEHGLPGLDVRAFAEAPDGSLWIATFGDGVARFDGKRFDAVDLGLASDLLFDLAFDRHGWAWFAGSAGLSAVDPEGEVREIDLGRFDDLSVFRILEGGDGRLWLCTNRGVARLDHPAEPTGRLLRFFDQADGMPVSQCNGGSQPSGWRSRDGALWFPTPAGVAWIHPGEVKPLQPPPPVMIERVLVDGKELSLDAAAAPSGSRRFEIDYTSLWLAAPERVRYRYRLSGVDDDWVDAGSRRTAFYTNLSPGSHEFEVTAANRADNWIEPTRMTLEVTPRVYETLAFRLFALAVLAILVVLIVRWRNMDLKRQAQRLADMVMQRTSSLMKANEELEDALRDLRSAQDQLLEQEKLAALGQMVAGVAHEINTPLGNAITVTSHLSDRCRRVLKQGTAAEAQALTVQIGEQLGIVQEALSQASNLVRSFKRASVKKGDMRCMTFMLDEVLTDATAALGAQIRDAGHTLETDFETGIRMQSFPDALREIVMHLVSNSLQHGFQEPGGTISLAARRVGDHVEIEYRDDGKGMNQETRVRIFEPFFTRHRSRGHSGMGMHIAYNLTANLLAGRMQCLETRRGTRFRLTIPTRVRDGG